GRGVYWVVRNGLYPMTPGNHGIRTVLERDYDRTALLPTVDLVRAMWDVRDAGQKKWASVFMSMSNVGYRAHYRDFDEEIERLGSDLRQIRPIELREVPLAPRYYLADHLVEIEGKEEFVDHLVRQAPEPETAFVHFDPFVPADGSVVVIDETSSTIHLEVWSEGDSLLVLSITPHKYWKAEVDGESATLDTVNIGYQGLRLPRGRHEVVLRYRNPVVMATAPVSAAGLLAVLVVAGSAGRRRDFGRSRDRRASETLADADGVGEHTGGIAADRDA
ncbi:MAG: YfhO family protein, partial [Acidobacteria bacterium]|nr:YfhO family protein [Acidobacteriota bacterium]